MTSTLDRTPVADCIQDLYEKARAQRGSSSTRPRVALPSTDASPQERADAASDIYMPISPTAGRLVYSLIRAAKPTTVLEFGMSYGISTLHLAAAVRDNGSGRVVTTELSAKKIAAARETFAAAGLADYITLLPGDARETLAGLDAPPGLVFLDGWKDLCLPVLRMLEPRLPS